MRVVGNKSKDIGMGIRKSIVVPCLDAFCGFHPYICPFIFKMLFWDLFRLLFF